MNIYSVIDIDIVGSRKLTNREFVQDKIRKLIHKLNVELEDILITDITLILGDEWQIILKRPEKSYYVISRFQEFLRKMDIEIYAGIGIGTISTGVDSDTRNMDGECFIKAREAINIAKNKNVFYNKKINSKDNKIYLNAVNTYSELSRYDNKIYAEIAMTSEKNEEKIFLNEIINLLIENNEALKSKITKKQMSIIELYERKGSYNKMIEEDITLTKAEISQKLNKSNYFLVNKNNMMIEEYLNTYCKMLKAR